MASGNKLLRHGLRGVGWLLTLVLGFTLNAAFDVGPGDWIMNKITGRDPLEIQVSRVLPERPPSANWALILTNTEGLQEQIGPRPISPPGADCAKLWTIGRSRDGRNFGGSDKLTIILRGRAKGGVSISNLSAVVTARSPAPDGTALLGCFFAMGSTPPIGITFDFTNAAVDARVQGVNSDKNLANVLPAQFADGYRINIAENETVVVTTELKMPADAIDWHFEADADIDGQRRVITIRDTNGEFRGVGMPKPDALKEAYLGGLLPISWGPVPR